MDYSHYRTLAITRRGASDAVLDIQMRATNGKLPTAGHDGHRELAEIWRDLAADDSVRDASRASTARSGFAAMPPVVFASTDRLRRMSDMALPVPAIAGSDTAPTFRLAGRSTTTFWKSETWRAGKTAPAGAALR